MICKICIKIWQKERRCYMVRLSLKGKMTLAVSLFTIVLLTTMSYYTFSYFQTEFKEVIASQQSLLLSYIADDIDNKLNRAQENLIQMSKKIQWYEAINPDQAQSFLDDNNIENTFDNGMFLFSNSGKLIAETPFLPNRRGKDFSFREYLRDTMETASPHISDPYISSKTHFPAIMFTAPVFDPRGKIVAVMGGSIDLMNSNILGKLASIQFGETGYVYLYNTDRTIIIHPDKDKFLGHTAPEGINKLLDKSIQGFEGTGETNSLTGVESLSTFKRLKHTNWILAVNYPLAEAYEPVKKASNTFLNISAVLIIPTFLFVWYFMKYLTDPLESITQQVRTFSTDDNSDRLIRVNTNDETGELADAFNRLIGRLIDQADILRKNEDTLKRFELLSQHARDIILFVRLDGRLIEANEAAVQTYGYTREELLSLSIGNLRAPGTESTIDKEIKQAAATGILLETIHRRKDGSTFPVEVSSRSTVICDELVLLSIIRDITDRKRAEEIINHLAYHDPLTDLPNRLLFYDRLNLALKQARRNNQSLAIMFLDLDRFKFVNDTMGHPVGDKLLQEVARRLKSCVRASDTLARMGGDEFTLLLQQITDATDAVKIAGKITQSLKQPWYMGNLEFHITTSIGIALYPNDGLDAETLMKHADVAMYRAKEQGDGYRFFNQSMNEQALQRLSMEQALRKALERDEFAVHYQPLVDTQLGKIIGAEALLRWEHPEKGLISAADFVPLAESNGMIIDIGKWVLEVACRQIKDLQSAGFDIPLTVNLSPHQLRHKDMIRVVSAALSDTGINPNRLWLEITEGAAMQDVEFTVELLSELKDMGCQIAIDDFGTGYSSLNYLKRLPITTVKIDRSFVRDINTNREDAAIVGAIIVLARNLKMKLIVEGVETDEQRIFFENQQCFWMQGFLFSRPVPSGEFMTLLKKQNGHS